MSIQITPETIVSRNEGILSSRIGNEEVMMHVEEGKYFSLNSISTRIWELIESPISPERICDELVKEYDISPEECTKDVIEVLQSMLKDKIIQFAV